MGKYIWMMVGITVIGLGMINDVDASNERPWFERYVRQAEVPQPSRGPQYPDALPADQIPDSRQTSDASNERPPLPGTSIETPYTMVFNECKKLYEGCTPKFFDEQVLTSKLVGSHFAMYYFELSPNDRTSVKSDTADQIINQVYASFASTAAAENVPIESITPIDLATVLLYEAVAKKKLQEWEFNLGVKKLEETTMGVGIVQSGMGQQQQPLKLNAGMKAIMIQVDKGLLTQEIMDKLKKKEEPKKSGEEDSKKGEGAVSESSFSAVSGGKGVHSCWGEKKQNQKGNTETIFGQGGGTTNLGASMVGDDNSLPKIKKLEILPVDAEAEQFQKNKEGGGKIPCLAVNWPKLLGDPFSKEKTDAEIAAEKAKAAQKAADEAAKAAANAQKEAIEAAKKEAKAAQEKADKAQKEADEKQAKYEKIRDEAEKKAGKDLDGDGRIGSGSPDSKGKAICGKKGCLVEDKDPNAESTDSGSNPYNKCGNDLANKGYNGADCLLNALGGPVYKPLTGCDLVGMPGEEGGACGEKKTAKPEDLDLNIFFSDPTGMGVTDPAPMY